MTQTKPVTQADLKALREQLDRAERRLEAARQALSRARRREREARKAYEAAAYPLRLAEAVAEAMLAEKGSAQSKPQPQPQPKPQPKSQPKPQPRPSTPGPAAPRATAADTGARGQGEAQPQGRESNAAGPTMNAIEMALRQLQ